MSQIRRAVIMCATVALVSPTGAAFAASSQLTPTPPPTFTQAASGSDTTTSTPASGVIPRTGSDLPEELLVAGVLIAAGATLRARRPSGRGWWSD